MNPTSKAQKPLFTHLGRFLYVVVILLLAAVIVASFVKAPSSGAKFVFECEITDAQTGQPVRGASVVFQNEQGPLKPAHPEVEGSDSATSDDRGKCRVHTLFPGSGSRETGKVMVWRRVHVRCEGYEPWSKHYGAIERDAVSATKGPSGTYFAVLKVALTPRKESQPAP